MTQAYHTLIHRAYDAFNIRDIDAVLSLMHEDVLWPNGWEGGYVKGHDEVRDYWTRQWKVLNPTVTPVSFKERADGKMQVLVHQVVKDIQDKVIFDGNIHHTYLIKDELIKSMEIEKL